MLFWFSVLFKYASVVLFFFLHLNYTRFHIIIGNTFSRNHTTLNPDKIQFWKFNLDSIALIDLPTMIDFVLDKTNQSQLIYLGYSQGGFVGMALLSERPEYNQKIALMHSMGGAIIMKNSHAIIAPFLEQIAEIKVDHFDFHILIHFPLKMSSIHSWWFHIKSCTLNIGDDLKGVQFYSLNLFLDFHLAIEFSRTNSVFWME